MINPHGSIPALPPATASPPTQAVKFAGSKRKLLPQILQLCRESGAQSILDGFAGSTRVSQALAHAGFSVHSNDIAPWFHPFATCFLQNPYPRQTYQRLIDALNALPPKEGWFSTHYGGSEHCTKKPWQLHNTQKLDAIREAIDAMGLSTLERAVCLTSLMLALDEVDSTLGHHSSYLRQWSKRSFRELRLQVPCFHPQPLPHQHCVTLEDIFSIVPHSRCDLAYFDPPYGSNNDKMPPSRVRYAAYYHLWTTIALNDQPETFGKAARRTDSSDRSCPSVFEDYRKDECGQFRVIQAIDSLLAATPCPWMLLSYSSGGRANAAQLHAIIERHGTMEQILKIDHRRHVMTTMRYTGDWIKDCDLLHQEYLFLLRNRRTRTLE